MKSKENISQGTYGNFHQHRLFLFRIMTSAFQRQITKLKEKAKQKQNKHMPPCQKLVFYII